LVNKQIEKPGQQKKKTNKLEERIGGEASFNKKQQQSREICLLNLKALIAIQNLLVQV
jgi:hypothetical protein